MNEKEPTLEQTIALLQLAAQLLGVKWTIEDTINSENGTFERSLDGLTAVANRIWKHMVNSHR